MHQLGGGFLETTKDNLVVGNELAAKVCGLVNSVDGPVDLFKHDVVKHRARVSLDFDFLVKLFVGNFLIKQKKGYEIVVWNVNFFN